MIVYSGLPLRFRAQFKERIDTWAADPKASPVMGFETDFGTVDLIRHTWGRDIHVAPEREVDFAVLEKFE